MRKKENINDLCNDDKTEESSIVAIVKEAGENTGKKRTLYINDRISIARSKQN